MATQAATPLPFPASQQGDEQSRLRDRLSEFHSRDVVVAVVGYAGSGTTHVVTNLGHVLNGEGFESTIIKARYVLTQWASKTGRADPASLENTAEKIRAYQDLGDNLRQVKWRIRGGCRLDGQPCTRVA